MAPSRYSAVAVALHWAIAILIFGQIAGGFYMHNLPNDAALKFPLYQLHKSFGLSILMLTIVRLFWRLSHRPPALPPKMPDWQKLAAHGTHWAFYALMFLTPLVGWAMVSVSPLNVPTEWFGLFGVPHLPLADGSTDASSLEDVFKQTHKYLAFVILGLLAFHVAAALKHLVVDRDRVFASMSPLRLGALGGILSIFAFLCAGTTLYLADLSPPTREELQSVSHDHYHDDMSDADTARGYGEADEPATPDNAVGEPAPLDPDALPAGEEHEDHDHDHGAAPAPAVDAPNATPVWLADYDKSSLRFIGEERDKKFEGAFADFTAEIAFDPDDLAQSSVKVVVATATGSTGGDMRDTTITDREWFHSREFPNATFTSTEIRRVGAGAYEADGVLAIKDFDQPITIAFNLDIAGAAAIARGGVDLVRTDFGLGLASSWLDDEKIALEVRVEFEIYASRKR